MVFRDSIQQKRFFVLNSVLHYNSRQGIQSINKLECFFLKHRFHFSLKTSFFHRADRLPKLTRMALKMMIYGAQSFAWFEATWVANAGRTAVLSHN